MNKITVEILIRRLQKLTLYLFFCASLKFDFDHEAIYCSLKLYSFHIQAEEKMFRPILTVLSGGGLFFFININVGLRLYYILAPLCILNLTPVI